MLASVSRNPFNRGLRIAPLLILALLLCASGALAGVLRGQVIDDTSDSPVSGVKVLVAGMASGAITDEDGSFELGGVPDQPFTLVATHLAYETRLLMVNPMTTGGSTLRITLAPTYYQGEKVVISASRYSPDLHLSQSNITRAEIQRSAGEKDIPLLLEQTPGLYASSDAGNGVGYTYLKLRGFDQKRIGVMINGIPLNDPEDHEVYWVNMPDLASSLEDAQIQRGVTNSLGGMSAIGGSVNLITQMLSDEAGGQFSVATGSYGTDKQSLTYQSGLLGGHFSTGLRISHLQSDGYRDRTGSDQWAAFWSGRYITPATSTQINIYTGREITGTAWEGLSEDDLANNRRRNYEEYPNAIDNFSQPHYELHNRWNLSESAVLRNSLYYIHGEGYYENAKDGRDATDFGLVGLINEAGDPIAADDELDLVRRKYVEKDQIGWVPRLMIDHGRGRLIVGGDIYTFESRHWGEVIAADDISFANLAGGVKYYEYTGDKISWSAYVNEQFELGSGLTALLDLHYQRKSYDFLQQTAGSFTGSLRNAYTVDYDFFNPKVGVFWNAPDETFGGELGLYAHVGLAKREPTDAELFDTWDGPDDLGVTPLFGNSSTVTEGGDSYEEWTDPLVEEEQVIDYELGASWRGERLSFAVNAYLMNFENEIVGYGALNEDGGGIRGNADKTVHKGIELGLTAKLSSTQTLEIAASRSWDEYETFLFYEWDGNVIDLSGNPIALFPEYLSNVTLISEFGPVSTSLRLRSVGKQYLDNTGDAEHLEDSSAESRIIDGYSVIDITASLRPANWGLTALGDTWLDLRISNVADTEYETKGYYDAWGPGNVKFPAAGRNFLLGMRHEF